MRAAPDTTIVSCGRMTGESRGETSMTQTTNAMANYYEAQMEATAGVVQAALSGMHRLQEITLRAMREGAGEQLAYARSVTEVRDANELSRLQTEFAGPAAEQMRRFQAELLQAITETNAEVVRASYAMMERLRDTLSESSGSMGAQMPFEGGTTSPLAMYEAGLKQWQSAMQKMMPGMPGFAGMNPGDEDTSGGGRSKAAKPAPKKSGGRR
jgi:phasin family protein